MEREVADGRGGKVGEGGREEHCTLLGPGERSRGEVGGAGAAQPRPLLIQC